MVGKSLQKLETQVQTLFVQLCELEKLNKALQTHSVSLPSYKTFTSILIIIMEETVTMSPDRKCQMTSLRLPYYRGSLWSYFPTKIKVKIQEVVS